MSLHEQLEDRVAQARAKNSGGLELPEPDPTASLWPTWLLGMAFWCLLLCAAAGFFATKEMMALFGMIALAFWLVHRTACGPIPGRVKRVLKAGQPAVGAIVMVNPNYGETDEAVPGVVVFADEPGPEGQILRLATEIGRLRDADRSQLSSDLRDLAWAIQSELPFHDRLPVPQSLTGGPLAWVASTLIPAKAIRSDLHLGLLVLAEDPTWTGVQVLEEQGLSAEPVGESSPQAAGP